MRTDKIDLARKLAIKAHGEQKYGDEFPYAIHLQAVESVLVRFGVEDEAIICAAWLHDTLEDTQTTYEELVTFVGTEVADIVAAVTEPKGGNRKWRHEQTYPRIRQNRKAIIVKLADRIANVESGGKKLDMYRKEYPEFKRELFSVDANILTGQMWVHLDHLMV